LLGLPYLDIREYSFQKILVAKVYQGMHK
jgi:hypothetical protein